jgi:hypothetical protein
MWNQNWNGELAWILDIENWNKNAAVILKVF